MNTTLINNRPIYLQVQESIEDAILTGELAPGAQIPSNSQLVALFNINPVTVLKATDRLVADGLVYKQRGVGMFVTEEAPGLLRQRYSDAFMQDYVIPMVRRAQRLGITCKELQAMVAKAAKMAPTFQIAKDKKTEEDA
jgi:DNA-binding transcriptional regulator YhcF (GntR family)